MFGLLRKKLMTPLIATRLGQFQQIQSIHGSRLLCKFKSDLKKHSYLIWPHYIFIVGVGEMNWTRDLAGEKFYHGKRKYQVELKLQDETNFRFFKIIETNPNATTSALIPEEDIDAFNKVLMNFITGISIDLVISTWELISSVFAQNFRMSTKVIHGERRS